MAGHQKDPLRPLTSDERIRLGHLSRSHTDPAAQVARFNRDEIEATDERHGGGQPKRYTAVEQERILREVRRAPDWDKDRTATWSISTLQGALENRRRWERWQDGLTVRITLPQKLPPLRLLLVER